MPGSEDYNYDTVNPDPALFHAVSEVSMADSNPAFYPPEQKSEQLLTEEEKAYLAEKEDTQRARGEGDVVTGDGAMAISSEEVDAAMSEGEERPPAKRSVPKSTSK